MAAVGFSDRVRASKMLRAARGEMSLEDFAAKLEVDPDELERWELGADFPAAVLVRALHLGGVEDYLFDTRQLRTVGKLTEETKRFMNSPSALYRRAHAIVSGKARLMGYALGASACLLVGAGLFNDAIPAGWTLPAQAAQPTVSPSDYVDDSDIVPVPVGAPITATATPTALPTPSPSPSPDPGPTPAPVPTSLAVRATPAPTAAPIATPMPTAAPAAPAAPVAGAAPDVKQPAELPGDGGTVVGAAPQTAGDLLPPSDIDGE